MATTVTIEVREGIVTGADVRLDATVNVTSREWRLS